MKKETRLNFYRRAGSILLWAGLGLFFSRLFSTSLLNHDFWWHLSAGRFIFENGMVPRSDFLSHTLAGKAWINFEWLSQAFFYGAFALLGDISIPVLKIGFIFSLMVLLAVLYRHSGARGPWLILLLLVGWQLTKARYFLRPELFSYLMLIALTCFLSGFSDKLKNQKFFITGFFLFFSLWANLHGGFLHGLAFIFLFAAGCLWTGRKPEFQLLVKAGFAGVLGALLNPFGWKIYQVSVLHGLDFAQGPGLIDEWISPDMARFAMFWAVFVVGSGFLAFGLIRKSPAARLWGPAAAFFLVLGALHARDTIFSAIIVIPFIVYFLLENQERFPRKIAAPAGWALLILFLGAASPKALEPRSYDIVSETRFPIQAARIIKAWDIRGNMFNSYGWGGYLGFRLGPDRKIFMDGRYLFHPLLREISQILSAGDVPLISKGWRGFFHAYKVDYALISLNSGFSRPPSLPEGPSNAELMFPKEEWALVYWDDHSFLFLQRKPEFQKIIDEKEFVILRPQELLSLPEDTRRGKLAGEQGRREWARHEKEVPFSVARKFLFGAKEQAIR